MSKYFHVSNGLRGAYMPDSASVIKVDRYRDLKFAIMHEAMHLREAGYVGVQKKLVTSIAIDLWREAQRERPQTMPMCLPLKPEHASTYSYGLFISVATRAEYLEHEKENA